MIERINKIKKFGFFYDYKQSPTLKNFTRYNLVYGWNASGKSTLSKIFRSIELGKLQEGFPDAEFEIKNDDASIINQHFNGKQPIIRVFNQDFVSSNLDLFQAKTEPIIYISEEKVSEKKELEKKKGIEIDLQGKKRIFENQNIELQKQIEIFHINAGKSIKDFFLGTIYASVNYNKANSLQIWTNLKKEGLSLKNNILNDEELLKNKSYILENTKKKPIENGILTIPFNLQQIKELTVRFKNLINKSIVAQSIERLRDNPEINSWVQQGLNIHKSHGSLKCEFCSQPMPVDRLAEIEGHFSTEYKNFQSNVSALIKDFESLIKPEVINSSFLLYDEFIEEYTQNIDFLNNEIKKSNEVIHKWIEQLNKRLQNPFSFISRFSIGFQPFEDVNTYLYDFLHPLISKHNKICNDFNRVAEKAKNDIENHFVAQKAISEELILNESKLASNLSEIEKLTISLSEISQKISSLEKELKSDKIALIEINDNLHRFLGRNDITLIRLDDGGYQLIRSGVVATNLSEGEKSAIGLVYFITKLKENDNRIENTIIVFDDPISSFDSNHLFNASAFILNNCDNALQLFILTHNFWFFKLIRDWMDRKNEKTKNGIIFKSNFYSLKNKQLYNASNSLTKYHSEYHFIFDRLLEMQTTDDCSLDQVFAIANYSRRLLESFNSFKTQQNKGFSGILEMAKEKGIPKDTTDKIYYFLNKYSHLDRIEAHESTIENIESEGLAVIKETLNIIKLIDIDHYNSMISVCNK
jgi:wobble nucleotide-excising tRNase